MFYFVANDVFQMLSPTSKSRKSDNKEVFDRRKFQVTLVIEILSIEVDQIQAYKFLLNPNAWIKFSLNSITRYDNLFKNKVGLFVGVIVKLFLEYKDMVCITMTADDVVYSHVLQR